MLNSEKFVNSLKDLLTKKSKLNLDNLINIRCFPVFVSTQFPSLIYENTFLSGDAFFTFPPSFAQGASQSIQTANDILNCILNGSNEAYDKILKQISSINKKSNFNHFSFHLSNPISIYLRNLTLKYLSKNKIFLENYLGKIYKV